MTKKQRITRYTAIFKEWTRRYEEDPESFSDFLDDEGKVISGYDESCANFFDEIERDLFKNDPVEIPRLPKRKPDTERKY